ncbi:hypothetical protein SLS62_001120 [Diatrype stigma]|uniref:Uncharacterized protein n=1 Tax=Diatrype stigma TaxID=117547 RepID=A0AAN9YW72_9PEZI
MSFAPTTPSHALPGAFLHTPAVASRFNAQQQDAVRRRLFREPSTTGSSANTQATTFGGTPAPGLGFNAPTTDDQTMRPAMGSLAPPRSPLAKAAGFINSALNKDENYPDLDQYCRHNSSEYDVPNERTAWAPFERTNTYDLPENVLNLLQRAEVSTMMGLFGELGYVWLSIDNCFYMWDYTHPNPELIGYEEGQHSITAVKLVNPKPGVFLSKINHILVIATVSEIFLLGVSATGTATGTKQVELYGTRMTLPLRGTEARVIAASATGRIFFAGAADSDIYELYYQQEEKWFSSRTGKINHTNPGWAAVMPIPTQMIWGRATNEHIVDLVVDDSRNLLYSLSNTSTVRTYYMEGADRLTKVIEKTKFDFMSDVAHHLSVHSPLLTNNMEIVSISPISASEDARLHLMALTNTGCRLFMNATSATYYLSSASQPPQSMQLQAIKFPPSQTPHPRTRNDPFGGFGGFNETLDVQSDTLATSRRGVRFPPGYFVDLVTKTNEANDLLFVSSPDSGKIKHTSHSPNLRYYEQANWIRIGGRAEDIGLITKPFGATAQPVGFGNELAVQFDDPQGSEFAVLTNTGVYVIRRRRFVEIFAEAIRGTAGDEGLKAEIQKFQSAYGRVETITAALAAACRRGDARRLGTGRGAIDQATQDRAKQVFINFGGSPTLADDTQPPTLDMVRPSTRHKALAQYLSRLIRSVWKARVVSFTPGPPLAITSVVPPEKLRAVQESVENLRRFLDENRAFIQGLSGPADLQRAGNKQEEIAFQGEHQAMHAVEVLMTGITEGISFVRTLLDERVVDIYARLDQPSQEQLRDLTYERLFSQAAGKELAKVLVKAIVNRNIENGSNVETVADALRRKCGSFCSPDDVVIFKAQEQLKRASEQVANSTASRTLLHESLKLFQRVAGSLTQANLELTITQYMSLKYYAGAIQLCLTVANERDRGNSALSWVNDGKPAGDPREAAFNARKDCYTLVHAVLFDLDEAIKREPDMADGKPTLIGTKRAEAYDVVNNSSDEVFHFGLYEWYIQQGWTDRLLMIESPHATTFLRRLASQDVEHADLLCRFYTMRGRYFDAAKVQSDLAKSDFDISIKDRLTLLSKAKTNASVSTTGVSRQEQQLLNHQVTELLEVAHIQDDLLERLLADTRIPLERQAEIRLDLDGQIQGLTELFNNYADQAGYYDLCLLIYHAADFRNAATIAQTWSSLIQKTHEDITEQWEEYHGRRRAGQAHEQAPPQPYEKLVLQVQDVCHRSGNDSFIFPVATLLPEICRYAYENDQDGRHNADVNWPVLLFLNLGVSYDLVARVLEHMFEAQEVPFRGNGAGGGRVRLAEWIVFVLGRWVNDLSRRGGPADVQVRLDPWVADLVTECETFLQQVAGATAAAPVAARGGNGNNANNRNNPGGLDPRDILRNLREVKRAVEGLAGGPGLGSLRGSLGFF